MFDIPLPYLNLADAAYVLTAAYWICFIVGGGMLLFSVLGGLGHGGVDTDVHGGLDFHTDVGHADMGADAGAAGGDIHVDTGHLDAGHANVGHAHGGHAGVGLSTWFSIRFVVFFLALFGAVGIVLTYVAHASTPISFAVALAGGLIVGQSVHQLFRALRRNAGNSTPQAQDYVNRLGRVTIAINGAATGEVLLQVRGGERYVPAVARSADTRFAIGDEVVVVAYRSGVAEVVSRQGYERTRSA